MSKKQYKGIKYPFTDDNKDGFFLDLNGNDDEKIKSELLHLIFTPKGQRIRMPDYGTDLIKYIFEDNEDESWARVKSEITDKVSKYIPKAEITGIEILEKEDDNQTLKVKITYNVKKGKTTVQYSAEVEL